MNARPRLDPVQEEQVISLFAAGCGPARPNPRHHRPDLEPGLLELPDPGTRPPARMVALCVPLCARRHCVQRQPVCQPADVPWRVLVTALADFMLIPRQIFGAERDGGATPASREGRRKR
jgi:hypothetical protein